MRDTCCFKYQGWGGHFKCTRREVSFKKAVFWKAFELLYVAQRNGNVPGFLSLPPVSVSAQIVQGLSRCPRNSMDNCSSRGRRDGDGKDGQIFIGLKGKSNFPHVASYLLGPCTCLAHALISLRIIMPGLIYALRFIQMEDIKPCWCHVAVWNICPLPPPPRGSEEALKKKKKKAQGHSLCLCLISALIGLRPMLLQLIYFPLKHMFRGTSKAGLPNLR